MSIRRERVQFGSSERPACTQQVLRGEVPCVGALSHRRPCQNQKDNTWGGVLGVGCCEHMERHRQAKAHDNEEGSGVGMEGGEGEGERGEGWEVGVASGGGGGCAELSSDILLLGWCPETFGSK